MATVLFSPIFNAFQGFTPAGLPLSGGLISTYLAGTATPAVTYTTSAGDVPNSNPIVLDASGRTPGEVWLLSGQAYKFVLTDSLSNSIATFDNINGIQQNPSILWVPTGTPSFVNATQFTEVGNVVSTFPAGIRIQYTINTTQYTGTVSASSLSGGLTTVTIIPDSQILTSGLNTVNVSQFTPQNSALPVPLISSFTPTWFGATTAGTTSYSTQSGYGVLMNGFFFYNITLAVISATGTGTAQIGGLPYQPSTVRVMGATAIVNNSGTAMGASPNGALPLFQLKNSTNGAAIPAAIASTTIFELSGFYPV